MRREMSTRFSGSGGWPGWLGVGDAMWLMPWCASWIDGGLCDSMGHYMGCGLGEGMVAALEGWGFENDTEVAAKVACVLVVVSLKRKCSRFFCFMLEYRKVSPVLPAT